MAINATILLKEYNAGDGQIPPDAKQIQINFIAGGSKAFTENWTMSPDYYSKWSQTF